MPHKHISYNIIHSPPTTISIFTHSPLEDKSLYIYIYIYMCVQDMGEGPCPKLRKYQRPTPLDRPLIARPLLEWMRTCAKRLALHTELEPKQWNTKTTKYIRQTYIRHIRTYIHTYIHAKDKPTPIHIHTYIHLKDKGQKTNPHTYIHASILARASV